VQSSRGSHRRPDADRSAPRVVLGQAAQCLAVEQRGTVLRPAAFRLAGRLHEVVDGAVRPPGVAPVPRHRRDRLGARELALLEVPRDGLVPLGAALARQRLVGDVTDHPVLEGVLLLTVDHRTQLAVDEVTALEGR